MAWDICITAEGWSEIYDTLHDKWSTESLIAALVSDCAEGEDVSWYDNLQQDTLADLAYERVEQHNTCDNGGNGFYIDAEGYYKVYLP